MNQNTVIYLEQGFANTTYKALIGYLACMRETISLYTEKEKCQENLLDFFIYSWNHTKHGLLLL